MRESLIICLLFIVGLSCKQDVQDENKKITNPSFSVNGEMFTKSSQPNVIEIGEGVYSIGAGTGNFYSMVIITEEGVAVIDPARDAHAELIMKEIRKLTDQPIKYMFYTHNHWDHSKGGRIFKDAGATVIAHEEANDWLEAHPREDLVQPDMVWSGSDTTFVLGGKLIDLHYYGINHGMGMTVFRLPEEKVVYIADIVIPHRIVYTIVPDFTPTEWIRTLKEIEKLDIATALFSHGNNGQFIGDKNQIIEVRQFLEDLRAAVKVEYDKGVGMTDIPALIDLPKYHHWDNYDDWIEMNVLRMALDLHFGPYPWRKID